MAHYAKVLNNIVVDVIAGDDDFFKSFKDTSPGIWIQTSFNTKAGVHVLGGTPLRKNYAAIGYEYHPEIDAFVPPKGDDSFVLDTDQGLWVPPVPKPTDGKHYEWDKEKDAWYEVISAPPPESAPVV